VPRHPRCEEQPACFLKGATGYYQRNLTGVVSGRQAADPYPTVCVEGPSPSQQQPADASAAEVAAASGTGAPGDSACSGAGVQVGMTLEGGGSPQPAVDAAACCGQCFSKAGCTAW
jgi:hypothetical protein